MKVRDIGKWLRHIGLIKEANFLLFLEKDIERIVHDSNNDIDYFNRDMRKDINELYEGYFK